MSHHVTHKVLDAEMHRCISACLDCHARCVEVAAHCLEMGGQHASRRYQVTLLDCAALCVATAEMMLRSSPLHQRACALCAEACRASETATHELAHGDALMLQCGESCRRCAESCERMAAAD